MTGDAYEFPRNRPVPDDAIIERTWDAPAPRLDEWTAIFHRLHETSEKIYLGDGQWNVTTQAHDTGSQGTKPLVRQTSRRVLGYLAAADVAPRPEYERRTAEGLEHLLRVQNEDGSFPWYLDDRGDIPRSLWHVYGLPGTSLIYETAIASAALSTAYGRTRDDRFHTAARMANYFSALSPFIGNTNYEAFNVWQQAVHHDVTGEGDCRLILIKRTLENILIDQSQNGGWPGHNAFTWYHGIIVRGLCWASSVLPEGHRNRPPIHAAALAAVNHVLAEIDAQGRLYCTSETDARTEFISLTLEGLLWAKLRLNLPVDSGVAALADQLRRAIERDDTWAYKRCPPGYDGEPKPMMVLDTRVAVAGLLLRYLGADARTSG